MKTSMQTSKSEFVQKYEEILQTLETFVSINYRKHPQMHDHDVLRVYENLLKYIKAKLTKFPLPEPKLEGVSLEVYCQQLAFLKELEERYSFQEMQDCLKLLEKSVKLWNRELGSQGYLNYISNFT